MRSEIKTLPNGMRCMVLAVHDYTVRHRYPPGVRENGQLWCLFDVSEVANQLAYID